MSEEEDELKEIIPIPLLSGDGEREVKITIKEDIIPHNGEEITHIVCSPNVKYVATWSNDDKSICGWSVIERQHQLNFDNSLTRQDLSSLPIRITTGDLKNVPTHVINYVDDFKDTFYFDEIYGIIDLKTKLLQKFEVQGLSALSAYEAIYARKLFQLRLDSELNSQDAPEKFLYPNVVISDFIVGVWDNKLWIQTLVRETKEWTEYLREELHDYNRIQIQFCAEEIELMMEDTLVKAKIYLNYNETRVIKKKSYYNGYLYTWIVEETDDNTFLTAWMFDHKALAWSKVGNKIQTFLSDIKLLTSEDIVAISPKGLFVWTVVKGHGIKLLYYWGSVKIAKPNAYYYELVIDQIEFLNDKLVFSKNALPPPSFTREIGIKIDKYEEKLNKILDALEKHAGFPMATTL
ncbi:11016_t:CDS:2, partial [Racocetra fulgida]